MWETLFGALYHHFVQLLAVQLRLLQLPFIFLLQSLSLLLVDDYLDFSSRLKTKGYAELSTVVFA